MQKWTSQPEMLVPPHNKGRFIYVSSINIYLYVWVGGGRDSNLNLS